MAILRIQVEIQKGLRGVALAKLSHIVGDVQQFLLMLSEDVGLEVTSDEWVGVDFGNGSLTFTAEKNGAITVEQVEDFNAAFRSIANRQPSPALRRATVAQYARIADPIEAEESVSFGLYDPPPLLADLPDDSDAAEWEFGVMPQAALRWVELTKSEAEAIEAEVQGKVRAYGALQGKIHSLFLGAQPAYFNLRELSTGALVKCVYRSEVYPAIAKSLQRMNAVLHVYGFTTTDLVDRKLEDMEVESVELAPVIDDEEFDKLFGAAPNFTGPLTTQEFMNYMRGRGN